jgi:hypothetical protein
MSWSVFNDMDSNLHVLPEGSNKTLMGLEIQQTTMQYNISSLTNVVLVHYRLINKGTKRLEDTYVGLWFDPDVDKASNDLVATDTGANSYGTDDFLFAYNGDNSDPKSTGGSAFGVDLLQGPIVDGNDGDTARFVKLTMSGLQRHILPGKKILPMTGSVRIYSAPEPEGDPRNDAELFNLLKGSEKNGDVRPARFAFPADPLLGTDLDPRMDDKRMILCTGPFNFAAGDTQNLLLACVGGEGMDRLGAITNLRRSDSLADAAIRSLSVTPIGHATIIEALSESTSVHLTIDMRVDGSADSVIIVLTPRTDPGPEFRVRLYDDGSHDDAAAGDGLWGGLTRVPNQKHPYLAYPTAYENGVVRSYDPFVSDVRLRPAPVLTDWHVAWENGPQNGRIDAGETLHLSYTVSNPDSRNDITALRISTSTHDSPDLPYPIPPGGSSTGEFGYVVLQAPLIGESVFVHVSISFDDHTVLTTPGFLMPPQMPPLGWGDTLAVIPLLGTNRQLVPIVADRSLFNGHTYAIDFLRDTATLSTFWRIRDTTTGSIKRDSLTTNPPPLFRYPIVDGVEYVIRPVDPGFLAFEAVANANGPLDPPDYAAFAFNNSGFPHPPAIDRPSQNQQAGEGLWGIHTADDGTRAGYSSFVDRTTRSGLLWNEIMPYDYEIRFTNRGGWAFDAYNSSTNAFQVPFELWNIGIGTPGDTSDDYRMIPWLMDDDSDRTFNMGLPGTKRWSTYDHSISGGSNDPYTDLIYWMRSASTAPGEAGYHEAEALMQAGTYTGAGAEEVMARMVLVNLNGDVGQPPSGVYNQSLPEEGTVFRITTSKSNIPGDVLLVTTLVSVGDEPAIPRDFVLKQNYPNPFNPDTWIEYALPSKSRVSIVIYNVIGQAVATIQDGIQPAGSWKVHWDASSLASGVYFCRLDAVPVGGDTRRFMRTGKMVLLK